MKTVLLQLQVGDRSIVHLLGSSDLTEEEIDEAFDWESVYTKQITHSHMARDAAIEARKKLQGRNVIVLGPSVWAALALPKSPFFRKLEHDGASWTLIPSIAPNATARKLITKLLRSSL